MIRTAIVGAGTREASRNSEDTHMPTPPPEAEEPFPPTDTPVPTETPSHPPTPTPTPNPYAHITIDADLCFNVNLHDPALRRTYEVYDASSYILIRCFDVIGRTIGERCAMNTTNGLDATVRACIKRNAEAVKDYRPRSQLAPECHSIGLTTDEEFFECMRDTSNHDNDLRAVLAETKSTIREDGRHAPGPHGNHRAAMERDLDTLLSLPPASYDACEKQAGRVSSLSLVRYRTNDYSVPAAYGHRDVLVRGYVDRVVISCGSEVIARHPRSYERDDFVFDPIHYLPLLERKTGALDQAAPLQGWELPDEFGTLRRLLESRMGRRGKREYVQVLRLLWTFSQEEVHSGGGRHQAGGRQLRRGEASGLVPAGGTAATTGPGAIPLPAQSQGQHHVSQRLHDTPVQEGGMSNRSTLLLEHHLKELRLPSFLREYGKMAAQCAAENVDHPEYLLRLAELELIDRHRRMVERRIRAARFPAVKSLDSFDFPAIPSVNKALVMELARCEYVQRRENVIAVGNSGTGKTHMALGLGLAACQGGMSVGFTTPAALVHELMEARDERRLLNLQRQLSRLNLLIIDELGFVPLSRTGAELLFEVFSQRYERGSILVTTNLPFDEWTKVFGSERLTGALLDRLTHHVHILEMNGESYRLKRSRESAASLASEEPDEE